MRQTKKTLWMALAAGVLLAGAAVAQQHEDHQGGPPPAGATPAAGCCANMGNPPKPGEQPMAGMSHGSMDMSSCPHMQAGMIADQLLASYAELEKATDMAAMKLKLEAHGNLLKQLKSTTEQKCPMMENMGGMGGGMMGGGMMGGMGNMQHDAPKK